MKGIKGGMNFILAIIASSIFFGIIREVYHNKWDKNLEFRMNFSKNEAMVGEEITIVESVINNKSMAVPVLMIKFFVASELKFKDTKSSVETDNTYRCDILTAKGHEQYKKEIKLICSKRGIYKIDNVTLVEYNVFFDEKEALQIPQNLQLIVYPKLYNTGEFNMFCRSLIGEIVVKRSLVEDPFEFTGIRDYQITDNMKDINWSASARGMEFKVNTYGYTVSQSVRIVVNLNKEYNIQDNIINETSISLAASIADQFLLAGVNVSLCVNAIDNQTKQCCIVPQGSSGEHLKKILYACAAIDTKNIINFEEFGLECISNAASNEWIFLISNQKNLSFQQNIVNTVSDISKLTFISPSEKETVIDSNSLISNIIPWYI